jgi:hypothetical protein
MFDLKSLKAEKSIKPPRFVIYGEPKVGKSTFASGAPDTIFLDLEGGIDALEVAKLRINNTEHFNKALDSLLEQDHDFKTVVIDSADWLERYIHEYICETAKARSITDKSNQTTAYGNGYILAKNIFSGYLQKLDKLRNQKGMAIVMIAHSLVRKMEQPDTESYDSYVIKMHEKASSLMTEWADILGFARLKTLVNPDGKASSGERMLVLSDTKYATVGNRYNLPNEIPLKWDEFNKVFAESIK